MSRAIGAADEPARRVRLAVAQTREAESLADLKQTASALELLDKAVMVWSKPMANPAAPAGVREGLSESLWERARLLRTLGRTVDAEKTDLEREGLWKGRSPNDLVALAGEEASRAAVIGYGKTALDAQGETVRQLELDQAAANLRLSFTMGYSELGKLKSDPRFARLLSRGDIRLLRMDITFPAWPFDRPR